MEFLFETTVPASRDVVFRFHERPSCLAVLHQGWSRMRLLAHESRVRVGGETWVEHTVFGVLPLVMGFRHTVFEPPYRFGEELIHGPFSRFRHLHEFEERGSECVVRDRIDLEWPWQYGGALFSRLWLERGIRQLFQARARAVVWLADDGTLQTHAEMNR